LEDVLRIRTLSETRGFLKALIEKEVDRILDFTAFGAMPVKLWPSPRSRWRSAYHIRRCGTPSWTHLTMAEGLADLFSSVPRG
jgi:hypothetical protein